MDEVTYGEWYSMYLMNYLAQGYTLSQAILYADQMFSLDEATNNIKWDYNPTNSENRVVFGDSSITINLN